MSHDFLSFFDLPQAELLDVIEYAGELKRDFEARTMRPLLAGKRIAAIWDAEGFRNRVAFELGARLMGAELVEVPYSFGKREDAADIARYLDSWFDAVIVRTADHAALQAFADASSVPVINARTRHNHPCEVLGDLAYIHSQRGDIDGLNVVYVGQPYNICHSWLEAAAALPIRVTHVTPPAMRQTRACGEASLNVLSASCAFRTTSRHRSRTRTSSTPIRGQRPATLRPFARLSCRIRSAPPCWN